MKTNAWTVKSDDVSPAGLGTYPGARSIPDLLENGFVILDKWSGPTSHDVTATVKQLLGIAKAGHAGTLDPGVSGVLLVTLSNGCKVIPALQQLGKEYVGIMQLHHDVEPATLRNVVQSFVGSISQLPPKRSAVARKQRTRNVYAFDILEQHGRTVLFRIRCSAGTYVRVICHDIGKKVGGAHMAELRRTAVGAFTEQRCVKIQDLADAFVFWKENGDQSIRNYILPIEAAIEQIGKIIVKDSAIFSLTNGALLATTGVARFENSIKKGDLIALLSLKGELIALAHAMMDADDMKRMRGLAAQPDRVIMKKGMYPDLMHI
ncbi:MAG: RNA-guided pseudouridylation complex pseudouridine synthase subunit Cbf5 [Candidatus Aenigmarchaeota archaeon]|nr:RNA-guided pseudouridylation complex pseudouridine synthase subunit Cbf5 [Candidatus Aenigmarchaeota archaeon]